MERVSKKHPPTTMALRNASLTLSRGESVAIVGPSGSGKSTLLGILGLLDTPTTGTYLLEGEDTGELSDTARTWMRSERIGFVFQSFQLIPHLTARENVELGLTISGFSTRTAHELATESLLRVGLSHRVNAMPQTLSGGEQQRVGIARAVSRRPGLLLCDEPTGNLDSASSLEVIKVLFANASDDTLLVIVTHDESIAARCTRVLEIHDGVVAERAGR